MSTEDSRTEQSPEQEAMDAATAYVDRCIAIAVEHGGREPDALTRLSAIVGTAKITERWIRMARKTS